MLHASDSSSGCGANSNRREHEVKAGTGTAKSSSRSAAKRNARTPIDLAVVGNICRGENFDPMPVPREKQVVFAMTFAQKCVRPAPESAHRHMASRRAFPSPGHRVQ